MLSDKIWIVYRYFDFVSGGKLTERVQYRNQDGHGERERDRVRERQEHELPDHAPGESLSDEVVHPLGDRVQKKEPGESRECEEERPGVGTD